MLKLAGGVKLWNLQPQMVLAAQIIDDCYRRAGVQECWITSGNNGVHRTIVHYLGCGLDFRIHNVPQSKRSPMVQEIKAALGSEFDAEWEDVGTSNEHLHVEYDPR